MIEIGQNVTCSLEEALCMSLQGEVDIADCDIYSTYSAPAENTGSSDDDDDD